MIEKSESKLSPGEVRLQQEVERLSRKLSQLTTELDQVGTPPHLYLTHCLQLQSKREEELSPLRARGRDLSDKLEAVRSQLVSARGARERSLSLSSLGELKLEDFQLENDFV